MLLYMIAILSSYTELLNKLDIDEKTKTNNKTMEDVRKESTMYEKNMQTQPLFLKIYVK